MVIHELTKQTGVPAKTIRYYESIGLLPRPKRAANNYRKYAPADVERLRFIASARALGFSLADVAETRSVAARDDVQGEHCVCYLLKAYRDTGHVTIQREEFFDD